MDFFGSLKSPVIVFTTLGLLLGFHEPVSNALFGDTGLSLIVPSTLDAMGTPGVALMMMVMAASLIKGPDDLGRGRSDSDAPSPHHDLHVITTLCFVRLLVIPAVGFGIVFAFLRFGWLGKTPPVQWLVIMLQFAVPSAQTAVVVMASLNMHELAQRLAQIYFFMYPLSIVTLTGWTALALYLLEQNGNL